MKPRSPRSASAARHGPRAWALTAVLSATLAAAPLPGQERPPAEQSANLEDLATRAVVLIDVQTAADSRQGSGFLVDPGGRILTNHHVVRDARTARVKLSSGDAYDRVEVLAADERRDIAVLQIDGFELPTLPLRNSDSVRIGSPVVLIGSLFGLENTVTNGIVSGRRQEPAGFQLLQISAPASRGSSGGPVLLPDGRVVGIAASQLQAGQNLNFAVPINYARGILQHVDRDPVAVLEATASASRAAAAAPLTSDAPVVNRGMRYALRAFGGYVAEWSVAMGESRRRRTRVTYRVIETVGDERARVERYLERETTERTEPFGTHQIVGRERVRSLASGDGLHPLSSRGERSWWTEGGWLTAEHELRFEGDRAVGVVTDTTGRSVEVDRVFPPGLVLREFADLAFGTLDADSLVGRSVELATLDPWTGEVVRDRYDVLGTDTVRVDGTLEPVLRVSVASGLANETVFFHRERPRIPLRRVSGEEGWSEELDRLDLGRGAPGGG